MSAREVEVFAVCGADEIARGEARSFSLSRFKEEGESRPFPIFIVRTHANDYIGYVNSCPHKGIWLNFGDGEFFTPERTLLKCGRHGSKFEIVSGLCIDGPCDGQSLEPIALAVVDGDVCVCGIKLAEDDRVFNRFDECDDTMEIMIHPE